MGKNNKEKPKAAIPAGAPGRVLTHGGHGPQEPLGPTPYGLNHLRQVLKLSKEVSAQKVAETAAVLIEQMPQPAAKK